MNILLIIAAVLAAVYGFAAIGYYYAFKNWSPMCGSRKSSSVPVKGIRWAAAKTGRGDRSA
ncbi:MAG TPA: hypothetical protein VLG39_00380 [Nitrospirota bacterium]|nr:hypothetical protein [Nitrospirota bacterium]